MLNYDCWLNIVEYLNIRSLKKLNKCNKFLYSITKDKIDKYVMEDIKNVYNKVKGHKNLCLDIGCYDIKKRSDIIKDKNNKMRIVTFDLFNIKKLMEMCADDYYKIVYYKNKDRMNYYKIYLISESTYKESGGGDYENEYERYENISNNYKWCNNNKWCL